MMTMTKIFLEALLLLLIWTQTSAAQRRGRLLRGSSSRQLLGPQPYTLWDLERIHTTLLQWKEQYPDFVRLETSQETYGLSTTGGPDDCPFDVNVTGCLNYYMTIQDFEANPVGSVSSNRLPEVLWSGALHGNERVGPTACMEAADLLLQAVACEALQFAAHTSDTIVVEQKNETDAAADACRQHLLNTYGMTDQQRKWLARLVTTRRLVVVPTANELGFYNNVREENGMDVNRDFPYDQYNPAECMRTIAGRTLNEIFREHMFQQALTFHAGIAVISYEWGAPTWLGFDSPDDTAQDEISAAYSAFAAGWAGTPPYEWGPSNEVVYWIRGGMEDWAYAGSWDPDRVIQCNPQTHGGYPAKKTVYTNSTLRAFNILIETSNSKNPPPSTLGTTEDVLVPDETGNGHVQRNIRLALLSLELVEPYVSIGAVNELELSDDVAMGCQVTAAVPYNNTNNTMEIQWTVGGALTVDNTVLWYAKLDDIPEGMLNCSQHEANITEVESFFQQAMPVKERVPGSSHSFTTEINIANFTATDQIVVIASARVDQGWTELPDTVGPDVPPQSHIVNARTNPNWHHETPDGKVIQGRLDWVSVPVTIELLGGAETAEPTLAAEQLSKAPQAAPQVLISMVVAICTSTVLWLSPLY